MLWFITKFIFFLINISNATKHRQSTFHFVYIGAQIVIINKYFLVQKSSQDVGKFVVGVPVI